MSQKKNEERSPDDDLFEGAEVPVQVGLEPAQVEHRVHNELPGAMVGHLPAALGAVQRQRGRRRVEAQVVLRGAGAQGVDGIMLQQNGRTDRFTAWAKGSGG